MIHIIAAVSADNKMGDSKTNTLPWKLPTDMQFFKRATTGNTVIMGRKTFESIGKALPNRQNRVVSSNPELKAREGELGIKVFSSLPEALLASGEAYIIGGRRLYEEGLKYADNLLITHVFGKFPEADIEFPHVSAFEWDQHAGGGVINGPNDSHRGWIWIYRRNNTYIPQDAFPRK